jgi:hypothetical protein
MPLVSGFFVPLFASFRRLASKAFCPRLADGKLPPWQRQANIGVPDFADLRRVNAA